MESFDGKLLQAIVNISINRRKVLSSTSFMAKSSDFVRFDLSLKNYPTTSLYFSHRTRNIASASLGIEKQISKSNYYSIFVYLYDFEKSGLTSWTTQPLVIEEVNDKESKTRLMLDLVVEKLTENKEDDIYWQYMVTFYEEYEAMPVNTEIIDAPAGN